MDISPCSPQVGTTILLETPPRYCSTTDTWQQAHALQRHRLWLEIHNVTDWQCKRLGNTTSHHTVTPMWQHSTWSVTHSTNVTVGMYRKCVSNSYGGRRRRVSCSFAAFFNPPRSHPERYVLVMNVLGHTVQGFYLSIPPHSCSCDNTGAPTPVRRRCMNPALTWMYSPWSDSRLCHDCEGPLNWNRIGWCGWPSPTFISQCSQASNWVI